MSQTLLKIASILYGVAISIRHALYDLGWLGTEHPTIPVICVGNITVGGTGKTPMVEMLVEHFAQTKRVAVLSRGYKRTSKGYIEVKVSDSYRYIGDEPLQIKRKYPDIPVVVCEDRAKAVRRMVEELGVELVIMDDGFQHRSIEPYINIVMVDATRQVQDDHLMPYGQLRDTISSLRRAHYFIVTKCHPNMKPLEERIISSYIESKKLQVTYFTSVSPCGLKPVFGGACVPMIGNRPVIAMSGIGNNEAFVDNLRTHYNVVDKICFQDHHAYMRSDLNIMRKKLNEHSGSVIVTTEKDAVKLFNSKRVPRDIQDRMLYEHIRMDFVRNKDDFFARLDNDISHFGDEKYIRS